MCRKRVAHGLLGEPLEELFCRQDPSKTALSAQKGALAVKIRRVPLQRTYFAVWGRLTARAAQHPAPAAPASLTNILVSLEHWSSHPEDVTRHKNSSTLSTLTAPPWEQSRCWCTTKELGDQPGKPFGTSGFRGRFVTVRGPNFPAKQHVLSMLRRRSLLGSGSVDIARAAHLDPEATGDLVADASMTTGKRLCSGRNTSTRQNSADRPVLLPYLQLQAE